MGETRYAGLGNIIISTDSEACDCCLVPGPEVIRAGEQWPGVWKCNKGCGWVWALALLVCIWKVHFGGGWGGSDEGGKRPRQGDSGILLGCPACTCRTYVKASSLQKPEAWLTQHRRRISWACDEIWNVKDIEEMFSLICL